MIRPILFRLSWLAVVALGLSGITLLPGCDTLVTEYDSIILFDSNFGESCVRNCHGDDNNILQVPTGQYENSAHASAELIEKVVSLNGENFVTSSAECSPCHSHTGYLASIDGSPADQRRPSVINCYTCHLPHTGDFFKDGKVLWSLDSLRGHEDVVQLAIRGTFEMGRSNMCANCHQMPPTSAPPTGFQNVILSGTWGPHYSPQADLVAGKAGARFEASVSDTTSHKGLVAGDGCIACHFGNEIDGGGIGVGYDFGEHTFRLEDSTGTQFIETCGVGNCHTGSPGEIIDEFYTSPKIVRIDSLAKMIEDTLWNRNFLDTSDASRKSFVAGDTIPSITAEVLYNYLLYKLDGSHGIHNPLLMDNLLTISAGWLDSLTPTAAFDFVDPADSFICQDIMAIRFVNQSLGNVASYSWTVVSGDQKFTSNNKDFATVLSVPGIYSVTLIAKGVATENASWTTWDTLFMPDMFRVGDTNIVAEIESDISAGCIGDSIEVIFTSTSASVQNYTWYFGDGTSVTTDTNAISYWYKSVDYFDVSLAVSSRCSYDSLTVDSMIHIGRVPEAVITTPDRIGCDTLLVNFTSAVTGGDDWSYRWYFGDGDTSSLENPTHQYDTIGTYSVSLAISSPSCGEDSVEMKDFILVTAPTITAGFETNDSAGCLSSDILGVTDSVPITFSSNVSGQWVRDYLWYFGDGDTSTEASPTHYYDTEGDYSVSLVVTNRCDTDSIETVDLISIRVAPKAQISVSDTLGCGTHTADFTSDIPTGSDWTWLWYFGDGNTSPAENPTHTYTDTGNYSVSLVISSPSCQKDSIEIVDLITVADPVVEALLEASDSTGCDSLTVTFTSGTPFVERYVWYFGDGNTSTEASPTHTYQNPGYYNVSLAVTAGCGYDSLAVDSLIHIGSPVVVGFTASDTVGCNTLEVTFNSTAPAGDDWTWLWSFGDGDNTDNNLENPTHSYSSPGTYTVLLTISSPTCGLNTVTKTDLIEITDSTDATASIFTVDMDTALVTHEFLFNNVSQFMTYWIWDFGDGTPTDTTFSPTHFYASPGSYTVELVVGNNCRADTSYKDIEVLPVQ